MVAAAAMTLYVLVKQEATAAAKAVGRAVDPTSDQNLAYSGVNAVGSAISGDQHWTLGGWLYDVFNPDQMQVAANVSSAGYEPRALQVRREAEIYNWLISRG